MSFWSISLKTMHSIATIYFFPSLIFVLQYSIELFLTVLGGGGGEAVR